MGVAFTLSEESNGVRMGVEDTMELFGETARLMERALDARMLRHEYLLTNIAHAETPAYQAQEVGFAETLRAALQGNGTAPLRRTHPRHQPGSGEGGGVQPAVYVREAAPGPDGNTVRIEEEMALLAENAIAYQATVQLLGRKLRGLKEAIREAR